MTIKKMFTRLIASMTMGTLLAVGLGATAAQAQPTISPEVRDVFNLTNNARASFGLNKLTMDTGLTSVAQGWSEQQARENRMYHNPNNWPSYPAGWTNAGENVLYGTKTIETSYFFQMWMDSPGHRANILNPNFTHIGVGWAKNDTNAFGTQNFARYNSNPTPAIDVNPTPPVSTFNHRIAVVEDNRVNVKEGAYNSAWSTVLIGQIKAVATTQNRVAVLQENGELRVKEGGLNAGWVLVDTGVSEFALDGNRIGVVSNGTAKVKEGNLYAGWVTVSHNTRKIILNGSRLGIITNDHALQIKEGSLYAGWTTMAYYVKDAVLNGNRVGIHDASNTLYVKEGALNAGWVRVFDGISTFDMSGNRIGIISNGSTLVKEGNLSAGWVTLATNTKDIELSSNRVIVVNTANQASIKEGNLYAGWVQLSSGTTLVDMNNS